ncbi:hypothetical protein Tco_0018591 [Tanacetum coccineum]
MAVKSAFLYGKIAEEVRLCLHHLFSKSKSPQNVNKRVKARNGLHQAPSWTPTPSPIPLGSSNDQLRLILLLNLRVPFEQQPDHSPSPSPRPSPNPSPTPNIPDSIPEHTDHAKEIKLLNAKITKLKKESNPVINTSHSISEENIKGTKTSKKQHTKKKKVQIKSESKQGEECIKRDGKAKENALNYASEEIFKGTEDQMKKTPRDDIKDEDKDEKELEKESKPPQYPVIHHSPQETSEEVLQAREDLMKAIQTFLRKFIRKPLEKNPKFGLINSLLSQDISITSPKIDFLPEEFVGELNFIDLILLGTDEDDCDEDDCDEDDSDEEEGEFDNDIFK